ncbi:hypothetical protein BKA62DRAFT_131790 [Auriculariales sp. MPI-PUGE-AT-0066]|nr:hypothetical protein BKA62DRAFT_131790 [Auriculariales sp. MPI-PUGE-AT-0066]
MYSQPLVSGSKITVHLFLWVARSARSTRLCFAITMHHLTLTSLFRPAYCHYLQLRCVLDPLVLRASSTGCLHRVFITKTRAAFFFARMSLRAGTTTMLTTRSPAQRCVDPLWS